MIKKIEHFWKGLSSDRTQISALPPQEYGERFIKFMAGVTMSAEEAARDQLEREEAAAAMAAANEAEASHQSSAPPAPTYLPPAPPGMRSPQSPEPNPTIEKATRKATKKEKDVAREEELPDRMIGTTTSSTTVNTQGKANTHAVLPIVEEMAEAASVSGRSRGDSASGNRPFTPSPLETPGTRRSDGFTDLGPHGIGGRGPPTPPKTSYLDPEAAYDGNRSRSGSGASMGKGLRRVISRESLDKALPPLPQGN